MPEMSSCASGKHTPPASSASCAYTTLPPTTGLVVSAVAALPTLPPLPLLERLEHAAATRTGTSNSATSRRAVVRGEAGFSTLPIFDLGALDTFCGGSRGYRPSPDG